PCHTKMIRRGPRSASIPKPWARPVRGQDLPAGGLQNRGKAAFREGWRRRKKLDRPAGRVIRRCRGGNLKRLTLSLLAVILFTARGLAAQISPALIYDIGGKFDKAFNEIAHIGAERFKAATGVAYREFEIHHEAQREQALRRFASDGNSPIVVVGLAWSAPVGRVAAEFPDTNFVSIDGEGDAAKVRAVRIKEHVGSYLVGILAAMASRSKTVGVIGGMDMPVIRKFGCGYTGGARAAGAQ